MDEDDEHGETAWETPDRFHINKPRGASNGLSHTDIDGAQNGLYHVGAGGRNMVWARDTGDGAEQCSEQFTLHPSGWEQSEKYGAMKGGESMFMGREEYMSFRGAQYADCSDESDTEDWAGLRRSDPGRSSRMGHAWEAESADQRSNNPQGVNHAEYINNRSPRFRRSISTPPHSNSHLVERAEDQMAPVKRPYLLPPIYRRTELSDSLENLSGGYSTSLPPEAALQENYDNSAHQGASATNSPIPPLKVYNVLPPIKGSRGYPTVSRPQHGI